MRAFCLVLLLAGCGADKASLETRQAWQEAEIRALQEQIIELRKEFNAYKKEH